MCIIYIQDGPCCTWCFRIPRKTRESRECGCQFALLHRADPDSNTQPSFPSAVRPTHRVRQTSESVSFVNALRSNSKKKEKIRGYHQVCDEYTCFSYFHITYDCFLSRSSHEHLQNESTFLEIFFTYNPHALFFIYTENNNEFEMHFNIVVQGIFQFR